MKEMRKEDEKRTFWAKMCHYTIIKEAEYLTEIKRVL